MPNAELTETAPSEETKEASNAIATDILDSLLDELKEPIPGVSGREEEGWGNWQINIEEVEDVTQYLELEEKLLNLCLQLFDEQDELMKYKRNKLADSIPFSHSFWFALCALD